MPFLLQWVSWRVTTFEPVLFTSDNRLFLFPPIIPAPFAENILRQAVLCLFMCCFLLKPLLVVFCLCKTFVSVTLLTTILSLSFVNVLYRLSSLRLYTRGFLVGFIGFSGSVQSLFLFVGFSSIDDENPHRICLFLGATKSNFRSYHVWSRICKVPLPAYFVFLAVAS